MSYRKNVAIIIILTAAIGLSIPQNYYAQESQPQVRISMDFENAALKDILKALSRQTGINFIASDIIEGKKITVFLNDVSVESALASILEANGLAYEKQAENVYVVKPTGEDTVRTITKVYKLDYIQVYKMAMSEGTTTSTSNITIIGQPSIAAAGSTSTSSANANQAQGGTTAEVPKNIIDIIKGLLSKNGKITADRRNNSLVITDIPQVFPNIESAIKELDVEPAQIMIVAEIIETTTSALKRIGLEYGSEDYLIKATYGGASSTAGGAANSTSATFPTPFPLTENFIKDTYGTNLPGANLFRYGAFTAATTSIVLKMFAQDGDTKFLSRPKIMTINNEPAIIKASANTAIGTTSSSVTQTGQTISTAERTETGIYLKVTPQVNAKGYIFMYIEPSVSRVKPSTFTAFSTQYQDPSYRTSASTVMVRDGETVVVGGLIQTDNVKTTTKVPILGDIPILGEPFKSRYRKGEDTELLIFITPHVIKKRDNEYIIPKEATDREYMISDALDRYARGNGTKKAKPDRGTAIEDAIKRHVER